MGFRFPFGRGGRRRGGLVVLGFDGVRWRGVFVPSGGGVSGEVRVSEARCGAGELPGDLLDWAVSVDARGIRVLFPSEIHNMEMEIPPDLDWRQASTAVMWEVTALTGKKSGEMVNASTTLSALGVERGGGGVLTSSFDLRTLEGFSRACSGKGLDFEGAVSVQAALMALHVSARETRSLSMILHLEDALFAFLPPGAVSPRPAIRNISLSSPGESDASKIERRITRRLDLGGRGVVIYSSDGADARIGKVLEGEVGAGSVDRRRLDGLWRDLASVAAKARPDRFDVPCPLAVLPGKGWNKGAVLNASVAALLLVAAVVPMAAYGFLSWENRRLARAKAAFREFSDRRSALERENARLEKEIESRRLLLGGGKVDKVFVDALRLLAATIPRGVVLDSLRYSNGRFEIAGTASSQSALSVFHKRVDAKARAVGLKVLGSSLARGGDGTRFKMDLAAVDAVEEGGR